MQLDRIYVFLVFLGINHAEKTRWRYQFVGYFKWQIMGNLTFLPGEKSYDQVFQDNIIE